MNKTLPTKVLGTAFVAMLSATANSAIVNVNLIGGVDGSAYGTGAGQILAPIAYTGTKWNVFSTGTLSNLSDSDGNATGVDVTLSGDTSNGHPTDNPNAYMRLVDDNRHAGSSDWSMTLSGLTNGQAYDLYLVMAYGSANGGATATMTAGADLLPGAAATTGSSSHETAYVEGLNYAVLSFTSNGTDATFAFSDGTFLGREPLNAFQLESIPEPSGFLLLLSGTAGLCLVRRRWSN